MEKETPLGTQQATSFACNRHSAKVWAEASQAVLGHSSADVTQIYAERDIEKAAMIMAEVG